MQNVLPPRWPGDSINNTKGQVPRPEIQGLPRTLSEAGHTTPQIAWSSAPAPKRSHTVVEAQLHSVRARLPALGYNQYDCEAFSPVDQTGNWNVNTGHYNGLQSRFGFHKAHDPPSNYVEVAELATRQVRRPSFHSALEVESIAQSASHVEPTPLAARQAPAPFHQPNVVHSKRCYHRRQTLRLSSIEAVSTTPQSLPGNNGADVDMTNHINVTVGSGSEVQRKQSAHCASVTVSEDIGGEFARELKERLAKRQAANPFIPRRRMIKSSLTPSATAPAPRVSAPLVAPARKSLRTNTSPSVASEGAQLPPNMPSLPGETEGLAAESSVAPQESAPEVTALEVTTPKVVPRLTSAIASERTGSASDVPSSLSLTEFRKIKRRKIEAANLLRSSVPTSLPSLTELKKRKMGQIETANLPCSYTPLSKSKRTQMIVPSSNLPLLLSITKPRKRKRSEIETANLPCSSTPPLKSIRTQSIVDTSNKEDEATGESTLSQETTS